jgi:hypothetical protein
MQSIKKILLLIKIGFLSVFGTSRGLANVEEEIAYITGEKKRPTEQEKEAQAKKV